MPFPSLTTLAECAGQIPQVGEQDRENQPSFKRWDDLYALSVNITTSVSTSI